MHQTRPAAEDPFWSHFQTVRGEELAPTLEDRSTHLVATFPIPSWASKRDLDVTVREGVLIVTADARRTNRGRHSDHRAQGTLHIGLVPPEDILVELKGDVLRILIPSFGSTPKHVPIVDRDAGLVLA